MEEKRTSSLPLPLKVTPDKVYTRCMVMGPAAAQVRKPLEDLSIAGSRQKTKCQKWQIKSENRIK